MTTKIVWRLANRPTSEEVVKLLSSGIINKDEAREILFTSEEEKDRDEKSLKSEIKFLRELVEKMSSGNTTRIIETIREIKVPYYNQPWYYPYQVWCGSTTAGLTSSGLNNLAYTTTSTGTNNALYTYNATTSTTGGAIGGAGNTKFSAIKTF